MIPAADEESSSSTVVNIGSGGIHNLQRSDNGTTGIHFLHLKGVSAGAWRYNISFNYGNRHPVC